MQEHEALNKMVSPGMRRRGKPNGGVLQIWVTRACDKACTGCTQGSNLLGKATFITVEQFEQACVSLKDYFGTVGVFGGNPALHPHFEELCKVMQKHIPYKQRGLWCNKLFGKGKIAKETFNPAQSNLNVHLDKEAYDEFKRDWPEARPFGLDRDSRHSPPYVAMLDLIGDEQERWELISKCDINQHWSAMICVFRGKLRGYFCEIAGAQAMLHQHDPACPDLGVPIEPGWWKKTMSDFAEQARFHCHRCGIPLRGRGELAQDVDGTEQTTATHQAIYKPKGNKTVEIVTEMKQLHPGGVKKVIRYLENGKVVACESS